MHLDDDDIGTVSPPHSLVNQPFESPLGTLPTRYLSISEAGSTAKSGPSDGRVYLQPAGTMERLRNKAIKTRASLDPSYRSKLERTATKSLNDWYESQGIQYELEEEEKVLSAFPACSALQACREELHEQENTTNEALAATKKNLKDLELACPGESRARVMWWMVDNGADEETVKTLITRLDHGMSIVREVFRHKEVDVKEQEPVPTEGTVMSQD